MSVVCGLARPKVLPSKLGNYRPHLAPALGLIGRKVYGLKGWGRGGLTKSLAAFPRDGAWRKSAAADADAGDVQSTADVPDSVDV